MATINELPGLLLSEAEIRPVDLEQGSGCVETLCPWFRAEPRRYRCRVAAGEITPAAAKVNVSNAKFLFAQAVTNISHVILAEAQKFLNKILGLLRDTINGALRSL